MTTHFMQKFKTLAFIVLTAIPALAFGHGEETHGNLIECRPPPYQFSAAITARWR